tara:strand:- start:7156 stop:7635 length:480 start_codon:yes stop_codon:yes gene_type:complete
MGLDMYLTRKHNVRNWSHREDKQYTVTAERNGNAVPFLGSIGTVTSINEEVMYWRKANAIHNWFVDNVQEGNDDCGVYEVELDQLQELRHLCIEVLHDRTKAGKLLPCIEGFFYGGTEYDEYYFEDLENTAKVINKLVLEAIAGKAKKHAMWYEYTSSW